MNRALEIRSHLTRMLPEADYVEVKESKLYTKLTDKFTESITITSTGRALVLLQEPGDRHWEKIASVRLEDVIVCKGYTLIGQHAIYH